MTHFGLTSRVIYDTINVSKGKHQRERRDYMDEAKLREAMRDRGITVLKMCEELGISRKAFWSKCTGKSEFKQSEIVKICELLGMKDGTEIFFPKSVLNDTLRGARYEA